MAMFESLSDRLSLSLKKISGKASLSEKNIQEDSDRVAASLLPLVPVPGARAPRPRGP